MAKKYKLLNNVFLDGEVKSAGSVVEIDDELAKKLYERGSIGAEDLDFENLSAFDKANTEGTTEGDLIHNTQEADVAAQAKARAEIEARQSNFSGDTQEEAKSEDPLASTQQGSEQAQSVPTHLQDGQPQSQPSPQEIEQTLQDFDNPSDGSTQIHVS